MNLKRRHIILLLALIIPVMGVYCLLTSTVARNAAQISLLWASRTSLGQALGLGAGAPPSPTVIPTPTPLPTRTPVAPQTRYDLQVERESENAALRLQRGEVYIELGAYTYAVQDYEAAIDMDPQLAEAYLGRGRVRYALREWSAAMGDFEQAVALDPELPEAHAWHGSLLSKQGRYIEAMQVLSQAVSLDDANPRYRSHMAEAMLRSGAAEEALVELRAAVSLDPRFVEAYVLRSMVFAELGDYDAAFADLETALDIKPYSPMALNGKAWYYSECVHERLAEAEQLARRAIAGAKNDLERAAYLDTLGWIYYQEERYDDAVATLEEAAALATVEGEVIYADLAAHLKEAKAAQQ
jgi:tetratricopeptide (TPR) repeat protein